MRALARTYPGYGWETNVGYTTRTHTQAIGRIGLTPHHRRSFAPVRLAEGGGAEELPLWPVNQSNN
jgi:ribonuclease HII